MGPLAGLKVVELGGIGPAPFCCMLLSDLGAEIVRIDRIVASDSGIAMEKRFNLLHRGRKSVAMDLKRPAAVAAVKRLVADAHVVIEGFRPGVAERLGLGPNDCFAVNPAVVYGRMTGYGQDGPLAQAPGHDINYIALSGVLHSIGEKGRPPVPPLNLAGDFGGGALYLAMGVLSALWESRASGKGQVVDAAMVDGSASLMALFYGLRGAGLLSDERGSNRLDGGTPWYGAYETRDGGYIAVGSNEPRFYRETLKLLGLEDAGLDDQADRGKWPEIRARFAEAFRARDRDEWCRLAEGREVCIAPVLSLGEAPDHPHNVARQSFVTVDDVRQPAPAPRFSRTPARIQRGPADVGEHTIEALGDWGFSPREIADLQAAGAVAQRGQEQGR
ncbi:CoA transferase [Sphingomonas sp. CL5.1]|uniref:CaiB/BaiF CoA transferase family protein n=1 Tax=Sphingomonas sp. CL5.1 TaxID=2653203 RepID=UPI001581DFA1|nr:CaiB/BaiF CoA-transferase family protein [Sphingomonas sp. CL5.1]QKS00567.1 CoA transferase [Sphingomonas sp. CL5.1]